MTNEILESKKVADSERAHSLKMCSFLESEILALHELLTDEMSQVCRGSLAVHTYAVKDGQILELLLHLFSERKFTVTLLNGMPFLQLVLDNCHGNAHSPLKMGVPIEI